MNCLHAWVEDHRIKLNPRKCKALHVTYMKHRPTLPLLTIDQNVLDTYDTVKITITVQNNLKWDQQVDQMLTLANRKLFVLR